MSATTTKGLTDDKYVKQVTKIVNASNDPERMAAAEIALLELALYDLHRKGDELKKGIKEQQRKDVKKFYRALARTALYSDIGKHLGGESGDEPHPSGTPQDVHSGGGHGKFRQAVGVAGITAAFGLESIAESITNSAAKAIGPAVAYLKESSAAKGIWAVSEYFANKASTFQYFAKAVKEYGPFTAMRMTNAYFRYGGYDVPIKDGKTEFGEKIPTGTPGQVREGLIGFLASRLPNEQARDSGAKPPSEGFIIDRKGNVVAHGVGRGNDHYLPFSSRHLRKMRKMEGGEMVRRRMLGGPTAEDLHAAMMMGLDRLTVISGSGEFTVELTGRSHGLKLEHMQVLNRFNDLMDGKARDYQGFNSTLDTLMSEFPLHFKNRPGARGKWDDIEDPNGPKSRIMDELRDLFDVTDSGTKGGGGGIYGGNPKKKTDDKPWKAHEMDLPGAIGNESPADWFYRRRKAAPGNDKTLLEIVEQQYGAVGLEVPAWLENKKHEIKQTEAQTKKSPQQLKNESSQKAAPVLPDWAKKTANANPTETGSGSSGGAVDWSTSEYEFAYQALKDSGYNVDRLGNDKVSQRLLATVDEMTNSQIERVANHAEIFFETDDPADVLDRLMDENAGIGD